MVGISPAARIERRFDHMCPLYFVGNDGATFGTDRGCELFEWLGRVAGRMMDVPAFAQLILGSNILPFLDIFQLKPT